MQRTVSSPNTGARETSGRPRPALRYTIDAAAGIVFVDLLSLRYPAVVVAALRAIPDDPAYRQDFGILIDCCYLFVPTAEGIRELARACFRDRVELAGSVAVVATGHGANAGARFFATLTAAPRDRLRVFDVFAEAQAWLCLRRSEIQLLGETGSAARATLLHDAARITRLAAG
jgi:hypothetical protein